MHVQEALKLAIMAVARCARAVGAKLLSGPPPMELHFLGTASMAPSATRNVSATALRVGGQWWIFDAGEGTQHQIIRSSAVSAAKCGHLRAGSLRLQPPCDDCRQH